MRYTLTSGSTMQIRADHTTSAVKVGALPANTVARGDEVWTAPQAGANVYAGDKWLHVKEIAGAPADGWVAVIHLGKVYSELTDNGLIPNPPAGGVKRIIKAVITYETDSGAILTKEVFPNPPA